MRHRLDIIGLDFETYSSVDLREVGLENYCSDPYFRVLLAAVTWQDPLTKEKQQTLFDFVGGSTYDSFFEKIKGNLIIAHNASFEKRVLKQMGYDLPGDRFIDTAMLARANGAGGSLGAAAAQLLNRDKMVEGVDLIKMFCIPTEYQKMVSQDLAFQEEYRTSWYGAWKQFGQYCLLDSELSFDLAIELLFKDHSLDKELRYSAITMDMNSTGWFVDLKDTSQMQHRYKRNLEVIRNNLNVAVPAATDLNLNSTPQLKLWFMERGIKASSFDEKHVASMIKRIVKKQQTMSPNTAEWDKLDEARLVLVAKQLLGGSALKKLPTILSTTATDGRLRDQYMHIGAGQTFRTSGRGVQMQNLKRLHGEGMDLGLMYVQDWSNEEMADNLRQLFRAEHPQGQLIVGDFSSIESRALAWQAGEQWKLNVYGLGGDVYKTQAASMFRVSVDDVTKDQRQVGKVGELSCGYGAGPDAVRAFADKMGVDLSEQEATDLVKDWRAANPRIVEFWGWLNDALNRVLTMPGVDRVPLPFGEYRFVTAAAPQSLRDQTGLANLQSLYIYYYDSMGDMRFYRVFHGVHFKGRDVCYWKPTERKTGNLWVDEFTDPKTKQRRTFKLYGGKLAGILTQSLAREMFFHSLELTATRLRFVENVKLIGQFHDEIVLEWTPPQGAKLTELSLAGTIAELNGAMTNTWLPDFPLAAEIKHAYRYIK